VSSNRPSDGIAELHRDVDVGCRRCVLLDHPHRLEAEPGWTRSRRVGDDDRRLSQIPGQRDLRWALPPW